MDKKALHEILDGICEKVAKDNDLNDAEARTFVGVALRRGEAAFLATVNVPKLAVEKTQNRTDAPTAE